MPKTTKEIIRESYLDKGLFFFKYNRLNFVNDDKWTGQTWYSQDEVEQLRKELIETIGKLAETEDYVVMENLFRKHLKKFQDLEISNKYVEKTINKKIDSVFAKVIKGG